MNLATKQTPWMVASLLAVTSIFGASHPNQNQNQNNCCPPQPTVCKPAKCCVLQYPQEPKICAYNAPAEINVGCQGDIDIQVTASFILWQPMQDNMTIGFATNNNALLGTTLENSIKGNYIEHDFSFKPGFKVGLGANCKWDDWDAYAEYTRVHGTSHMSSNGQLKSGVPAILQTYGYQFLSVLGGQLYNTVHSEYKNNLDFLDVDLGRTYYVGKRLIFRPSWGARAAWILQSLHVKYVNLQSSSLTDASGDIVSFPSVYDSEQRSHSWGVGPRAGLMMDWMLGHGIRFFGSGYGDLLYTKYKVKDKSVLTPSVSTTILTAGHAVSINGTDKPRTIRTHLDFEMGLGWGTYFSQHMWHFDFSAAYGWQVFFDQNMFRHSTSTIMVASSTLPEGNLYVQGLTATVRFDF